MTIPVRVECEPDDGQADTRSVFDDRHTPILIKVRQLLPGHPAARVAPADVAPPVAANAAVDIHAYIGWDPVDDRKIERRPCPQVGGFCGHSRKCRRKIRGDG
jgi:hypothetical protein